MSVCAVVGGQFGSEGKGLIVGRIAKEYSTHVRVGAANAGHTFYTQRPLGEDSSVPGDFDWEKHVMQQLPCAAYANVDAGLVIGPGAIISEEILDRELRDWDAWRRARKLGAKYVLMDPRAHVVTEIQKVTESDSDLVARIGSTSATAREGIGACQAARVMRREECVLAANAFDVDERIILCDVPMSLSNTDSILLEGTQGAGLSLTTGPFPFVTSRNTTSAGLCADVGIAPNRLDRVILVCRTFPIRVAGNSGPFWGDSIEGTWEELGVDPESERTTVTKKIRRVASFSLDQVVEAAVLNGATEIALTFCDYLDPGIAAKNYRMKGDDMSEWPTVESLVRRVEERTNRPVTMLGTGPHSIIERGSW